MAKNCIWEKFLFNRYKNKDIRNFQGFFFFLKIMSKHKFRWNPNVYHFPKLIPKNLSKDKLIYFARCKKKIHTYGLMVYKNTR